MEVVSLSGGHDEYSSLPEKLKAGDKLIYGRG